ncbi:hypothetical protein [Indiicoccus explosivorum]|uniref:hypothetical protein n=1 Tax=Indiicoccus explosivorum TaxID=1917864 RepID=UPI000B43E564|nr:hypothetical protein [Indiicoccus explosivorum]
MRYGQYKKVVEREFGKPLGSLMRSLCKEERLSASEGAKRLGVPKEMFIYWRHHYRLEPKQLAFDRAVTELDVRGEEFAADAGAEVLNSPPKYADETSLRGLAEEISRNVAYYKKRRAESEGLDPEAGMLPLYEFAEELVTEYMSREPKNQENSQR